MSKRVNNHSEIFNLLSELKIQFYVNGSWFVIVGKVRSNKFKKIIKILENSVYKMSINEFNGVNSLIISVR